MSAARYFALTIISFMALAAVVILIVNLVRRQPKPMMGETSVFLFCLSGFGLFSFMFGMWLLFENTAKYLSLGLGFVGGGFFTLVSSTALNAKSAKAKRSAWPVVSARCIKQTLQKHHSYEGGDFWLWRLVCEMNYAGKHYQVVSKVRWSDASQSESPFWTEAKAQKFIADILSKNGECELHVNPSNPLETEILIRK